MTTLSSPLRCSLVILSLLALVVSALAPATASPALRAPQTSQVAQTTPVSGVRSTPSVDGRLSRVRVVSHNVQRRPRAVARSIRHAKHVGAQMIALQEVCAWQADDLRQRHPDWSFSWKADNTTGHCLRPADELGLLERQKLRSGNLAIWTKGRRAVPSRHTFRRQVKPKYDQGLACLHWTAGVKIHLCSVHLVNAGDSNTRRAARLRQAREVRQVTAPWVARDELVVLAGDFNASLGTTTMDQIYSLGGRGRFVEATRCLQGRTRCRLSLGPTKDGDKTKIDYVFFSANRLPPGAPHGLAQIRTSSDHHLLSGWARVETS